MLNRSPLTMFVVYQFVLSESRISLSKILSDIEWHDADKTIIIPPGINIDWRCKVSDDKTQNTNLKLSSLIGNLDDLQET